VRAATKRPESGDRAGACAAERAAMSRAIELAALGLGTTSPNPVVGCV